MAEVFPERHTADVGAAVDPISGPRLLVSEARDGHDGPVGEPVRPEDVRAGDADRERVAEQLRRAQAEGRLDIHEYDERLGAAWAARTYRDLELVTADLPPEVARPPAARTGDVERHRPASPRGAVAAWASASVINLVIWGIVSVASASWVYPWWIWVAGPWGAVLLAGWIAARITRR